MLDMSWNRKLTSIMCVPAFALGTSSAMAGDAEAFDAQVADTPFVFVEHDEVEMKISGAAGIDYNTHFILWGYDVWGQGDTWGAKSTLNPWAELSFDLGTFTATVGTWWDVNDNAPPSIGSQIQEIDMYYGISTSWEDFSFGIMYQDWYYGGSTEKVVDFTVGYDDSEIWGGDFALNPSFTAHRLLSGGEITGVKDAGWAFAAVIEPGFTLIESETMPVDVTIPVAVLFGDDDFYADSGVASVSVGAIFSMPVSCIPSEYGEWTMTAGVTYYMQDDDALPNPAAGGINPDDEFLTGTIGLSLSF